MLVKSDANGGQNECKKVVKWIAISHMEKRWDLFPLNPCLNSLITCLVKQ